MDTGYLAQREAERVARVKVILRNSLYSFTALVPTSITLITANPNEALTLTLFLPLACYTCLPAPIID